MAMAVRLISGAVVRMRPVLTTQLLMVQPSGSPQCTQVRTKRRSCRYLVWPNDWLPFDFQQGHPELGYFRTGDIEEPAVVFQTEYRKGFEWLQQADDVPEDVKKQFRLSFAKPKESSDYKQELYVRAIAPHPYDVDSFEARIAQYTFILQSLRYHIRYVNPDNARYKRIIIRCWGKRTKLLNEISRVDREKYELIKKVLRIDHTAGEPGVVPQKIQRKRELRRLTQEYCDKIRNERLAEYRAKLQSQQQGFLDQRDSTKTWIEEQMALHNISEEDLEDYRKARRR